MRANNIISPVFTPARCATTRHTIGLVVPEITNYGFAVFSHEQMLCREAGVQLLISCTGEDPARKPWWSICMIARRVDEADRRLLYAQRRRLHLKLSEQLPVVLFDRCPSDSTCRW